MIFKTYDSIYYLFNKLKKTGFIYIFVSNTFSKVLGFLSSILLVRILSKSEYGLYSYTYNLITIFLLINGLGTPTGMLQYGSEFKSKDDKEQVILYGFKVGILFNFLICVIIIIYSFYGKFKIDGAENILLFMAGIPLFEFSYQTVLIYLRVNIENKKFAILNLLYLFGIFILQSLLGYYYKLSGVIIAKYLCYIYAIVIGIYFAKKTIKLIYSKINLSKSVKFNFIKYSIIACATNAISQLLFTIDIFLIGIFISDANIIASYKVATIIPFALTFIPSSCIMYIYPHFAQHNRNKKWIREKTITLVSLLGLFNFIISLILFVFAPLILKMFFGLDYESAVVPFRILSVGYFITGTFRIPIGNILLILKKLKYNFFSSLIIGICNIILDILLIGYYGSNGAAFATLTIYLLSSIFDSGYLIYSIKKM